MSFEEYFRKQDHKDISLPYIGASGTTNTQTASLMNSRDIKWSPTKIIGMN